MSGKQKVLLVVVAVLLVALFVVAVGGRDPGAGDASGDHPFVAWLARLGGRSAVVPVELVSAPCLQPGGKLVVTGSCVVHVSDPGSLKMLVLNSAAPFQVAAPGPGNADFTAKDTVEPEDGRAEARVAVDKETDVVVACAGALSCVLLLGDR
jgi:hypothetical protein